MHVTTTFKVDETRLRRGSVGVAACALSALLVGLGAGPAHAVDYLGTVHFQGQIGPSVGGIPLQDMTVGLKDYTDATGQGTKCSLLSRSDDQADASGFYPDAGDVNGELFVERGGPNLPEGSCLVTVQATGTNGVDTSARGAQVMLVPVDDVNAGSTLAVPDITLRVSKAIAGVDKDCFKWVKKQLKKRAKCNDLILRKGGAIADLKCKDAGVEPVVPVECDPGNYVEAVLAFAHGSNDQQVDTINGEAVDLDVLKDQVKCQKRFGKAAVNYFIKRDKLVIKRCVDKGLDSLNCRETAENDSKKKLDQIDKCIGDQMTDGGTGRIVPDVEAPCDVCIDGGGVIDRKCMKGCFQLVVNELGDGLVGDVPVCGNGILQSGEFCDDGNTTANDCCSDTCTVENLGDQSCGVGACEVTVAVCQAGEPVVCTPGAPGVEGPNGDASCSDGIDNDCDGDTDGADADCL
jgi:cysteine-rich repeat protein